ncbi:hypothetical protein HGRIS_011118 [Hohenbuehelia grisea]|uniref:Extracellular membrane protein CFEM domain-containing protein n=1 Tax=Hohenbuehelia grisea TaxID=104357 RepID=A0ABR3IZ17_9AGAR
MLFPLCVAIVVIGLAQCIEARNPFADFYTRAVDPNIVPPACRTQCASSVTIANICTTAACSCTQDNLRNLVDCFNCVLTVIPGPTETSALQNTVNTFYSECSVAGFLLTPLAVHGSTPGSASPGAATTDFLPVTNTSPGVVSASSGAVQSPVTGGGGATQTAVGGGGGSPATVTVTADGGGSQSQQTVTAGSPFQRNTAVPRWQPAKGHPWASLTTIILAGSVVFFL